MNALDLARSSEPVTAQELKELLKQHKRFYSSGGGDGKWQVLDVSGFSMGVYKCHARGERRGEQADLSRRRLDGLDLRDVKLACANLVGVLCADQDLSGAVLINALITDGDFSNSRFHRAVMRRADLSRTKLRGCSFRGADMERVDFEGCDLTGADFSFANIAYARFKDATLDGVTGVSEHRLLRMLADDGER